MLLTVPLLNKGSFLGSLINKCRPAAVANLSLNSPSHVAKSLEEQAGLPPKPKKPLTPYFRYMIQERPKIHAANPKLSIIELVKQVSKQWEKVDASLKKRLLDDYKKDQQKYIEARTRYDSQITDEQRLQLKALKQEKSDAKEKRMMRKRIKALGRPKRPASAFLRFVSQERALNQNLTNESFKEWHRKTTDKWGTLSDDEKNVYHNEARKEFEKYKKELSLWEEKMIRFGHIDVVRQSNLIEPSESKPKK